jgi:asparagine synthetase B (glutamine-hydrolysing)
MVFGAWRRSARPLPELLEVRLEALLGAPGVCRVDQANATVAIGSPACLEQRGATVTAWAASGVGGQPALGHPSVRMEEGALTITAPPLPQYPLYYFRAPADQYLLVSSRLEPLARLMPDAALRAQRLVSLASPLPDPDRAATVYGGIQRLLPAESLRAGPDGVRLQREIPRIGGRYRQGRVDDLASELRERLDAAVGRAIGPSARVAVQVSGGLDSSGVLALAAARCRGASARELTAISLQYVAQGEDRPYFEQLLQGLDVVPVRLSASDAGQWFRPSLCSDGQPVWLSSVCLSMLLCEAASNLDAEVVLCGISGDRICGGPFAFAQWARRGHLLAAVNGALRVSLPWSPTPWGRIRTMILRPFIPRAVRRLRRRRAACSAWMTPRFAGLLDQCWDGAERAAKPLIDTPDEWMRELCEGGLRGLADTADLTGHLLAATRCAPVDVFLDLDFVSFMLTIDPVLLSHGHMYRGLYRLAMKGLLPEAVRMRQDKAAFEPAVAAAALAADAIEMLRDLSSLTAMAGRNLVDPAGFRPMFDRWLGAVRRGERADADPGDERWQQVWQLLSVEAFLREHGRGRDLV